MRHYSSVVARVIRYSPHIFPAAGTAALPSSWPCPENPYIHTFPYNTVAPLLHSLFRTRFSAPSVSAASVMATGRSLIDARQAKMDDEMQSLVMKV